MLSLEIGAREAAAWYESGNWPLIGTIATLFLTNLVSIGLNVYQIKSANRAQTRSRRIDHISSQLELFYNPLVALLSENKAVFDKLGPPSFPDGDVERVGASQLWSELRDKFILPNNIEISKILSTKTHLIAANDSLQAYLRLKLHIDAYAAFQAVASERYSDFTFPRGIEKHIEDKRACLISALEKEW